MIYTQFSFFLLALDGCAMRLFWKVGFPPSFIIMGGMEGWMDGMIYEIMI